MPSTDLSSANIAARNLASLLVPGRRICLTTHVNPDGDGLGSEVAMIHLLKSNGIDAIITNPSPTPDRFKFLFAGIQGVDRSHDAVKELRKADIVLVLDIAELTRLGGLAATVEESGTPVACIDHHVGPGHLPDGPRYVDSEAAATGELVYLLAREMGWEVTQEVACALYVALVTDTGSFRFSNTRPRTLRVAADLLELGADPEEVYLEVYASAPAGRPRLLAETLQTLVVEEENEMAWLTVPSDAMAKYGVGSDDLDGVIEHARAIKDIRLAVLFRHVTGGRIKVSFRSVGDVDVAELARHFGGGGHKKASGMAMKGSMDEVQQQVLSFSREFVAASPQG